VRKRSITNVAASVRQRLLNLARERREDFGLILSQYAIERLLYRLGRSPHAEQFVVKGAQLFSLWFDTPHRATRDLDLLCEGPAAVPRVEALFRALCEQRPDAPDGIDFVTESVRAEATRGQGAFEGVRMRIEYHLASARGRVQVDVGFGDAVAPPPEAVDFPSLLDLPAPRVRAYARETVVAEKLEAMVILGMRNSRMKDFYDLWMLARQSAFDGLTLCQAIQATFGRRRTPLPTSVPSALSPEFYEDRIKQTQWAAFLRKGRLRDAERDLAIVVTELREFLLPPMRTIGSGQPFPMVWSYAHGWQHAPNG